MIIVISGALPARALGLVEQELHFRLLRLEREHDLFQRLFVLDRQRAPREAVHGHDLELTVELNQADVAAFEKVKRAACSCIHDGPPGLRCALLEHQRACRARRAESG